MRRQELWVQLPLLERQGRRGRGESRVGVGVGQVIPGFLGLLDLCFLPQGGGSPGGLWAEEGRGLEPPRISVDPQPWEYVSHPLSEPLLPGLLSGFLRGSDESRSVFHTLQVSCFSSEGPVMCARHTWITLSLMSESSQRPGSHLSQGQVHTGGSGSLHRAPCPGCSVTSTPACPPATWPLSPGCWQDFLSVPDVTGRRPGPCL